MNELILVSEQNTAIARKIDQIVGAALSTKDMGVFERTYVQATALAHMEELMTEEYMKPIMKLQGKTIGFRTDEDSKQGYTIEVVRRCVMEAMLFGLQPYGNQFNIIAGKTYFTKEGYEALLIKIPGLWKKLVQKVPKTVDGVATVIGNLSWKTPTDKEIQTLELEVPVKVNSGMGSDAILGKSERKMYKWLYTYLTGNTFADGDTLDVDIHVVESKKTPSPVNVKPVSSTQEETPSKNDEHEEAEIVEDTKPEVKEIPISEEELERAKNHILAAENKEGMEKRFNQILKKFPSFSKDYLNEAIAAKFPEQK